MPAVPLAIAGVVVLWLARRWLSDAVREVGDMTDLRAGKWFAWSEMTVTSTGKPNPLTEEGRARLRLLVEHILDPLREHIGRPITVTSAWRSPAVNAAIGDHAERSQHMRGEAADIKAAGMGSRELAQAAVDLGLPFDQLIFYAPERGGHVHVSFTADRPPRREIRHGPAGSTHEPLTTLVPTPRIV